MASYGLPTNLLFCKLCQKVFTDPKLLPCLHTYCQKCLQKQLEETDRITCPLCGYFMSSPAGGVSSLTTNVFADRVVKQYINKIQQFANNENLSDPDSCEDMVSTLIEKAKYSPTSLSLFSLQKRDHFTHGNNMIGGHVKISSVTTDNNGNQPSVISEQPDLVQSHTSMHDNLGLIIDKLSSHMDHKLMALQGEALRVTYAIDSINQSVNNWREKRYQLKRKVEERSNILQHQIRRHEKRLLAEIDSRYHEEKVMKDAEKSKHTLRQNLKGILQTVEFLKQVQDYATEEEMVALKDRLMSCSVNISEVQMTWQELKMDIPTESPDVLMASTFGQLNNSEQSSAVFIPGSLEVEMDSSVEKNSTEQSVFNERLFTYSKSPPTPRRLRRQSQRVNETDEGDDNTSDVSVTVDQFRNMRESFKTRRRQLLAENANADMRYSLDQSTQRETPFQTLSQRRQKIKSMGGSVPAYYLENPDFEHQAQIPGFTQALPSNATSRDITERNEISSQMAHLSDQEREDKIKRMQNLRESWKRRKEVLMKNDGYISPDRNNTTTFDYEMTVDEVASEVPAGNSKLSRMKQLKNRFSQIRHHFKNESNAETNKVETASTDGVILRDKPKEKKEKRWSGIFRSKDSKRRSLSSRSSAEFVIDMDIEEDEQKIEKNETKKPNTEKPHSAPRNTGLTQTKLQQMRESVRKKTQRWRNMTSTGARKEPKA